MRPRRPIAGSKISSGPPCFRRVARGWVRRLAAREILCARCRRRHGLERDDCHAAVPDHSSGRTRVAASHLYRDDRLVYGSGPVQLGTYEYQRWAEPPVDLIQDSLISSLRSTKHYRSVSAIGSNLRGEYVLRAHLFSLDEVDKPEFAARFSIQLDFLIREGLDRLDRFVLAR